MSDEILAGASDITQQLCETTPPRTPEQLADAGHLTLESLRSALQRGEVERDAVRSAASSAIVAPTARFK
jgi:hypothetical protein